MVLECVWICRPLGVPRDRTRSCSCAICLFRLLMSCNRNTGVKVGRFISQITCKYPATSAAQLTCLIIYVSSSISTALSSKRDFLFATKNKNILLYCLTWNQGMVSNLNDPTLTNSELFQFGKCVAQVFSNSPTKNQKHNLLFPGTWNTFVYILAQINWIFMISLWFLRRAMTNMPQIDISTVTWYASLYSSIYITKYSNTTIAKQHNLHKHMNSKL